MNKDIQGSVSVSRGVNVGGDARVNGTLRVGHNLRVEGWLDAPNIKDNCKGLFTSAEQLKRHYPTPRAGWWALVGTELPADLYVSEGGAWVWTETQAGEPTLDIEEWGERIDDVETAIERLEAADTEHESDIATNRAEIESQGATIGGHTAAIAGLIEKAGELEGKTTTLFSQTASLQSTMASQGSQLGAQIVEVKEAAAAAREIRFVDAILGSETEPQFEQASTTNPDTIVYLESTGTIAARKGFKFYPSWPGSEEIGEETDADGVTPSQKYIYIIGKSVYVWTGTGMRASDSTAQEAAREARAAAQEAYNHCNAAGQLAQSALGAANDALVRLAGLRMKVVTEEAYEAIVESGEADEQTLYLVMEED